MMENGSNPMTLAEVKAAALALTRPEQIDLVFDLQDYLFPVDEADVADSQWIMEEMQAGRMKTIPAAEVLAELDRIVHGDWEEPDPEWTAELNRRIDEAEAGVAKTRSAEEVIAASRARRSAGIQAQQDASMSDPLDNASSLDERLT
jgi:hypothetical protein